MEQRPSVERYNMESVKSISLRGLAKRYGVNPKTVAMGSAVLRSLTCRQDPGVLHSDYPVSRGRGRHRRIFEGSTLPPLDDRLYALQPTIPHLTRSSFTGVCSATGSPGCRRSKAEARQTQIRPIRFATLFISTSPSSNREATLPARHRSDLKVRLRRAYEKVARPTSGGLPAPPDRRRPCWCPTVLTDNEPDASPRQAIRARRLWTSRPPWKAESSFGRTPSNTPAPRTTSITG